MEGTSRKISKSDPCWLWEVWEGHQGYKEWKSQQQEQLLKHLSMWPLPHPGILDPKMFSSFQLNSAFFSVSGFFKSREKLQKPDFNKDYSFTQLTTVWSSDTEQLCIARSWLRWSPDETHGGNGQGMTTILGRSELCTLRIGATRHQSQLEKNRQ